MDKKTLEARLKSLEMLKEGHEQDVMELNFCIVGLKEQISKMPDEVIATPNK
jgi:uncharacterized coiled-coil protein SlyX